MKIRNPLFDAVWKAREACAGSNVKGFGEVQRLLAVAINIAFRTHVDRAVQVKLQEADNIIDNAVEYKHRLPADDILCELLDTAIPEFIERPEE